MANDVKIRYRDYLPGAGVDASGAPKQGKMRVLGHVAVTSYVSSGEPLSAIELGVTTIDTIQMRVRNQAASPAAHSRREVIYSVADEQFYLFVVGVAGQTDHYADAATETVEFEVFGDSSHDVELL
jgi:hypothetical protein